MAFLAYLVFLALLFAACKWLPGDAVEGRQEPDGSRWTYRINGMAIFAAANLVVATATLVFGLSLAPLLDHFWELFLAANVVSVAAAVWLYRRGLHGLALAGAPLPRTLGAKLMGAELNPRWLGVDLKMFAYEPSLIGFGLLVMAFGYAQYESLGRITPQLGLYLLGWWLYLVTHYRQQAFLLGIWDIIAEKFGFMLLWGDLVLVPFFYCIAGWTLVVQEESLPTSALVAILLLYGLSLWIFRSSNAQKWRFKNDPEASIWGRPAESLEGRLLVSGWWGIGRHLNYTGEIGVYLALSLTTGFASIVPYLLPLWMIVLLAHRAERDDRRCRAKYGGLWERYCARAHFRMLPGIY
jgi:delta14-sterol reductase